ncbi:NF-X1-type zinc finger protein NFXL1 [Hypsibius exemplaris]|uniref:NF-X1-type zinc finger protein NFXL1 n=1 Tax=Hypsibius exemplaris TaxID=2072580 RepID=A0A1W0WZ75_HYPEX|nr:NF-X1-type zinc finger protein NFXL1 [Hypsibius exemplaris]
MANRSTQSWINFRPPAPAPAAASAPATSKNSFPRSGPRAALRQSAPLPPAAAGNQGYSNAERFNAIARQNQEGITRKLAQLQDVYGDASGSDEEEPQEKRAEILEAMLRNYKADDDDDGGEGKNVRRLLENATSANTLTCLICISTIKKNDAIWNCSNCCASLHLACIQKWAKDGIIRTSQHLSDEFFPEKDRFWGCPKCRFEFPLRDAPTRYYCYCGKTTDPKDDPWILPHSCGEFCGKTLKSGCAHKCVLVCHPGPCPPCPAQCRVKCFCGQQQKVVRCGGKSWCCGKTCQKAINCGKHQCQEPCHDGECPPCAKKVSTKCACGRETALQLCRIGDWHCQRVCGMKFDCGLHSCNKVCHSGDCGPCIFSLPRSCPCGKTKSVTDCSAEISPCGNTCEKPVCPLHFCQEPCHPGDCGPCTESMKKTCPCGAKTKPLPCSKVFTCDSKCKSQRNCGRHPCNKRCCAGTCPPCDQICSRVLNCRNHKCDSLCHAGPCYPCTQVVEVLCACGRTKVAVPCGKQRSTKPPKCNLACEIPPECHHPSRTPHSCHFGRCPPCTQICSILQPCGHHCQARCHSAVEVLVRSDKERPAGPWELKNSPDLEIHEYPCPPCEQLVRMPCLGGHDETPMKCCESRVVSCGRPCARKLECGNHVCQLPCHEVENPEDLEKFDSACDECSSLCTFKKPCGHPCVLACHRGDCPSCPETVRVKCHCGGMTLKFSCGKVARLTQAEKNDVFSCKVQCPALMSCDHPCTQLCHPADQPHSLPADCKKKCPLKCPCGRIREQHQCAKVSAGFKLVCDEECHAQAKSRKEEEETKIRLARELKEKEEALLQEQYDKKKGKKRPRNRYHDEEETPFLKEHWKKIAGVAAVVAVAFIAYIIQTV